MPAPKPLLTILQISDLHVGEIDPKNGDADLGGLARMVFANSWVFDGVLGHHARGLRDLAAFFTDNQFDQNPNFLLVVSGDLTRVGGGTEFDNAHAYLGGALALPKKRYGLGHRNWRKYAIPGNHDHWPGKPRILGRPHPRLKTYFPPGPPPYLPYVHPHPLGNGRTLLVVGIDTDADVRPWGAKRARAVGSFQTQLAAAAADPLLGKANPEQVRVLLLHHSWHRTGFLLSIDRGTKAALNQFLNDHDVRVILTGHTHEAFVGPFVPVPRGRPVLECRCGTTTQVDQVPYSWRNFAGTFPTAGWPRNTLLVHRLFDVRGRVRWKVETYYRDPSSGFLSLGIPGQASVVV